jgi:methionine synthase II (cobalamin-independent)
MNDIFKADGRPVLIGSLPLEDHEQAVDLVFQHTPEIPGWVQLPVHEKELMIPQFMAGLPGYRWDHGTAYVDTACAEFENELLQFYERYMAVTDGSADLSTSMFLLDEQAAPGFYVLLERLRAQAAAPVAVKGQVSGPFTCATGLHDQNDRALFYDAQLRDAVVKLLALRAAWQVRRLSQFGCPVIMFLDEPALAGFGSSEFISISGKEIDLSLSEVIAAIHAEGGLAGIHICANTDWALVLDSAVDIVNFDAYSYFDKFILYAEKIKSFLDAGRIIAWGIVPTLNPEDLEHESVASLFDKWRLQAAEIEKLGIPYDALVRQSLITPSCGAGALSPELAIKALQLVKEVSRKIRTFARH